MKKRFQIFTIQCEYEIGSDPTIVDETGIPSTITNNAELFVMGEVAQDNFVIVDDTEIEEREEEPE